MKRAPKLVDLPGYGTHMTIEEFIKDADDGGFEDDDGYGELATATQCSHRSVYPSDVNDGKLKRPKWATHVVWYNK